MSSKKNRSTGHVVEKISHNQFTHKYLSVLGACIGKNAVGKNLWSGRIWSGKTRRGKTVGEKHVGEHVGVLIGPFEHNLNITSYLFVM